MMMKMPVSLLVVPVVAMLGLAEARAEQKPDLHEEYPEFNHGDRDPKDKSIEWVQAIRVTAPSSGATVTGNVTVAFEAPGMVHVKASCWQQPTPDNPGAWGHDVDVASGITLDAAGRGSFVFPADQFPNGPITLRLYARENGPKQDLCQLQLFNAGGVVWNQGIPRRTTTTTHGRLWSKTVETNSVMIAPPAAQGMKLVFADDFDQPLSISRDGKGATYMCHKTGGGDFSGWPFSDVEGAMNPFSQVGTFLRIHASKRADGKSSSGILASARADHTGIFACAPCHFECRFLAHSAPGTWPAFWLLNKGCLDKSTPGCDELDVIEAYGGLGRGNPNFPGFAATTHYWGQKGPDGRPLKGHHADADMMNLGGHSSWSTTFHTYAIKITRDETAYLFDDIPFFSHPTGEISKRDPFWFLINYAIGGISGWKIDLARYNNSSDMWVDYVRVYQGDPGPAPAAGK